MVFFWDRRAKLYKVEDFKTLINAHVLPGQTEGLKGGFKEWVDGWVAKVDNVFLRLGGFAKVDNRFG